MKILTDCCQSPNYTMYKYDYVCSECGKECAVYIPKDDLTNIHKD